MAPAWSVNPRLEGIVTANLFVRHNKSTQNRSFNYGGGIVRIYILGGYRAYKFHILTHEDILPCLLRRSKIQDSIVYEDYRASVVVQVSLVIHITDLEVLILTSVLC